MVKQVNLSSPWQLRKVSSPKIAQQEQICDYDQFTTSVVSNVIFLEVHPLLDELKTKFKSQFTRTTTLKHWSPVSLSFFFFSLFPFYLILCSCIHLRFSTLVLFYHSFPLWNQPPTLIALIQKQWSSIPCLSLLTLATLL